MRWIADGLHIRVMVDLDDGCTRNLFSYYPDELRFEDHELIGLTVDDALKLYEVKDTAYLARSEESTDE